MKDLERALRDHAARLPAEPPARIGEMVAARAADEGLLDVAYGWVDSPLGRLTVAATPRGLVRLAYPFRDPEAVLQDVARKVSPRMLEAPERLEDVRRELDEYFHGKRRDFDLAIDWSFTGGFVLNVLRATAQIPFGDVKTYTEVATAAGSPRAVRAAGNALGSNPIPVVVPCHRVVRTGGGLGGYTGGLERKEFLLRLEGKQV